jgi:hypothetical protein
MNSYKFTITITNSEDFIIQAEDYDKAKEIAYEKAYSRKTIKNLCDPTGVDVEVTSTEDTKQEDLLRVWTYFDGNDSDMTDFVREWETLLDTIVTADENFDNDEGSWYCEAFVTQAQIDEFNMDEDWFTIQ